MSQRPLKLRSYKHVNYKIGDAITFKYGKKRLNGIVINGHDVKNGGGRVTRQNRELRIYNKAGFVGLTSLDLSSPKYQVRRRSSMLPSEVNYFSKEKK